ncbi:MAG: fumarate hydratase, partial [Candidatus Cloacimonetes bacterium]|nr:fumarate hydratase [Candidatus Cloacimonadota bacterium]
MRKISSEQIQQAVYQAITEVSYHCDPKVTEALPQALEGESNELAQDVLSSILENHRISPESMIPLCQDT